MTVYPRRTRDPQMPRTSLLRGEGIPQLPEWMLGAACAETDPELFFPDPGRRDQVKAAKAICHGCDIRDRCLDWALQHSADHYGLYGVWGMTTRNERALLLDLDRQMPA